MASGPFDSCDQSQFLPFLLQKPARPPVVGPLTLHRRRSMAPATTAVDQVGGSLYHVLPVCRPAGIRPESGRNPGTGLVLGGRRVALCCGCWKRFSWAAGRANPSGRGDAASSDKAWLFSAWRKPPGFSAVAMIARIQVSPGSDQVIFCGWGVGAWDATKFRINCAAALWPPP